MCRRLLLSLYYIYMDSKNCVGCKTYFEEGTMLPPEGISVELKNYSIPIKDPAHKLKLLRTIVSFLNSKGGTIFIGAVDETRQVVGVTTQRKEEDNFRIFIQQLTDRILPKVDLTDKEEITVQFVPVVTNGKFTGKHLIKVIVKQGNPSEQYCFCKKIQLQAANDKKIDEYEIVYSCIRLNSGNLKQLKGYELVQEAKQKSAKPHAQINCFHEECNPQPLCLSMDILKIGFSNIHEIQTREIMQQWFEVYLKELGISEPVIGFDKETNMIVVEFENKNDLVKVEEFVTKNLKDLNENLVGVCQFEKKDKFLDCIVFENVLKQQPKPIKKESGIQNQKWEKITKKNEEGKKNNDPKPKEEQEAKYETHGKDEPKEDPKANKANQQNKQLVDKSKKKKEAGKAEEVVQKDQGKPFKKNHSFAFTHINSSNRSELVAYLEKLGKSKKIFGVYKNTVEVFLPNFESYQEFYNDVVQNFAEVSQKFGFKNQIKFGVNTGVIDIMNYDKTKTKQVVNYLKSIIGKEIQHIEPYRQGNRHIIRILLKEAAACVWLDKLLEDKQIKSYCIPGAEKGEKPKMKIFLVCENPEEDPMDFMYL